MFERTRHVWKHMEQWKLRNIMVECDSSLHPEASKEPTKAESYWPISLTSCLCKVLLKLALGVFAVCLTENALYEAAVYKLADMTNLNITITAIRIITNPNHPIRPYCLDPTKLEDYGLRTIRSKNSKTSVCTSSGTLWKLIDRH
jgi:hypothetical protein